MRQVALQYRIAESAARDAHYKLANPRRQMNAYIDDSVRGGIPRMTLDELYEQKDDLGAQTLEYVAEHMHTYGFTILRCLITEITPEASVQRAMNEINAAQRQRVAAQERGEAEKIITVKRAEADAEAKRLQGEGVAQQRMAILRGYDEGITNFKDSLDIPAQEAMLMTLLTQYFDVLRDIGTGASSHTTFLPHSPAGMGDIMQQMRSAILEANTIPGAGGLPSTDAV